MCKMSTSFMNQFVTFSNELPGEDSRSWKYKFDEKLMAWIFSSHEENHSFFVQKDVIIVKLRQKGEVRSVFYTFSSEGWLRISSHGDKVQVLQNGRVVYETSKKNGWLFLEKSCPMDDKLIAARSIFEYEYSQKQKATKNLEDLRWQELQTLAAAKGLYRQWMKKPEVLRLLAA